MLDITHWTREDVQIAFIRACRPGANARDVAGVLRMSQEGDRRDMELIREWREDRRSGGSVKESALCDLRVYEESEN